MLYILRLSGTVRGVTQIDNKLFLVFDRHTRFSCCVSACDIRTFSLLSEMTVQDLRAPLAMVACRDDRQLYIAESCCIWRVSATDTDEYGRWLNTDQTLDTFNVHSLSLTSRRLLVTSLDPPSLHEYSTTDRQLLRVVQLPGYVRKLYHGVETKRGRVVISHQGTSRNEDQDAVSDPFRFST